MNWKKINEEYPKVHDELKQLESQALHYDDKNLIEIYHQKKGVLMRYPFTESLKQIEKSLWIEITTQR